MTGQATTRTCIFCGAGPPLTDEHAWPQWIGKVLPRGVTRHLHQHQIVGNQSQERSWRAPAYSQTVKRVCAPCNNGWMSKLETDARPLLTPMMQGRRRAIHRNGQRTLAAWALKTISVLEYVQPEQIAVPQQHREWLREHGEPPAETHVWLSGYTGELDATFRNFGVTVTHHEPVPPGLPIHTNGYVATMSIGHFVCQVGAAAGYELQRHAHAVNASLSQIWPAIDASLVCPEGPRLTSAGLAAIQDAFRGDR